MAVVGPIYTSTDSVKVRLAGKVAFQSGATPSQREMPDSLLQQIIVDAETAVEQDLRGRYAIPFRSIKSDAWKPLPDHTKRAIRTIVDMKACILILSDSFGSGTHITADGYIAKLTENYTLLLRRLLGQDLENAEFGERRFRRTPPLEDLKLAASNLADDGLFGAPMDANARPYDSYFGHNNFAADQVNDPSLGLYWPGRRGPR